MIGRRLNEEELRSYSHVPRALAEGVRVIEEGWVPGEYVGITVGNTIVLATTVEANGKSALLAHELVHVRQWHEMGWKRFASTYLRSFLGSLVRTRSWTKSYRAIPQEVEARDEASRWARARN